MPHRPLLLAALLTLGGCLGRVEVAQIEAWRQGVAAQAAPAGKPRLWYVGVGLYDETWSENDVAELADALRARADGFQVVPLVLSNGPASGSYPSASRANVDAATAEIARRAQPGDVALLYVSTHGAPGALARKRGSAIEPVGPGELREWLQPLGGMSTVVVLSACFSGSLFPALAADNRIVIGAARRDRTSFGCRAGAQHTVFGQALLDALAEPHESLQTVMDKVRAQVSDRERKMSITRPSLPQVGVGGQVAELYRAPVF